MKLRLFQLVIFGCLLLTLWPGRSSAQQNAVTWDIEAGFDGTYKLGVWFPVTITLANSGPDLRGTLSLQLRGGALSYRQTIDLPQGAKKRVVVPVKSDRNGGGIEQMDVTLRSDSTVVRSERVTLNAIQDITRVVGIISDEDDPLPELASINRETMLVGFMRLRPGELPDRAELLQSFDVLFVHAADTSVWTEDQRAALRIWIDSGGQLVVGGDERVAQDLADLIPATITGAARIGSIHGLLTTGWEPRERNAQLPLLQLLAKPTASVIAANNDGQPLLIRQPYGAGATLMAAFGLEDLRLVGNSADLWTRVLMLDMRQSSFWEQINNRGFSILRDALQLPELSFISVLGLLGFLAAYIVMVGPINYLILRRINRREWAYFTIPLWVLLFSLGAYVWGTGGRGGAALVNQLAIVRVPPQAAQGQSFTYVSLFSPTRTSYSLQLPQHALVSGLGDFLQRQSTRLDPLYTEDGVQVQDLAVDVGQVSLLAVEQAVAAPRLETTIRTVNNEPQMTLRNLSDQRLMDVVLLRGDGNVQEIDVLEPGAERTIPLRPDHSLYELVNVSTGGVIDRRAVVSQIGTMLPPGSMPVDFGPMPDMPPPPDDPGLEPAPPPGPLPPIVAPVPGDGQPDPLRTWYVLGWQPQAPLDIRLDGSPVEATGETLYIWTAQQEQ